MYHFNPKSYTQFFGCPLWGHPRNTLLPKYKYFVVQQFFNPKPWFGVENHFETKTNVLVSNNFLDTLWVLKKHLTIKTYYTPFIAFNSANVFIPTTLRLCSSSILYVSMSIPAS